MNGCLEIFDDMLSVTAIPVAEIPPSYEAWRVCKTVTEHGTYNTFNAAFPPAKRDEVKDEEQQTVDYTPKPNGTVTIGPRLDFPYGKGGRLIPIIPKSGKAEDGVSDAAAGRLHTVTVVCEVDDRDGTAWADLLVLERTPSHLLITSRNGRRAFAEGTEDTYLCKVERSGGKTSVTLRVHDTMGMQLLV